MAELRLDRVSRDESSETSDKSSSITGNSVLMDCWRDSDSLKENGHDMFLLSGAHTTEQGTRSNYGRINFIDWGALEQFRKCRINGQIPALSHCSNLGKRYWSVVRWFQLFSGDEVNYFQYY